MNNEPIPIICSSAGKKATTSKDAPDAACRKMGDPWCERPSTEGYSHGQPVSDIRGLQGGGSHTKGHKTVSPSKQPSQSTTPQVLVVSSTTSYYCEGMLADRPTKILLDIGSALTLVRMDHWNDPYALSIPVTPTKQRLVGVDGNPLRVQGTAVVCITRAQEEFTTKVTIVDDISAEAILRMDFLATEDCCIDVGRRVLSIQSQELQLELCSPSMVCHKCQ